MPVGAIALWSLLNGAVPTDWAECNGTANSPGPDLRDRFIVGRGAKTVDTTGGSATHTAVAAHVHGELAPTSAAGGALKFGIDTNASGSQAAGLNTASAGDASVNHEPPWYAIIYIQRMT